MSVKLIAGPCSAESSEQVLGTAALLALQSGSFAKAGFSLEGFRAGVWKPRTRPGGFDGLGETALPWLKEAQSVTGVPSMVEVASPQHVECALKAGIRTMWLGARTVTNPFDVQAIADALKGESADVFVKNPINPDTELWIGALERIMNAGAGRVCAIHRGFSFYEKSRYRNSPKWQVPIDLKCRMPEIELYCDPSHIGGSRDLIGEISQKALDLGFDGLFVECHCTPDEALSDSYQQLTPAELAQILSSLVVRDLSSSDNSDEALSRLREKIDLIDGNLLDLLCERMNVVKEIGTYKKERNLTILQQDRWEKVLEKVSQGAKERALDESFVRELFKLIHQESIDRQS